MGDVGRAITALAASAFALALASVIFSQRSQTTQVIQSGGTAFAQILSAATSPVTGTGGVTASSVGTNIGQIAQGLGGFVDSGVFN